jgi:methyl-accepting chemotaxis protein
MRIDMKTQKNKTIKPLRIRSLAERATTWVGSVESLILHTILFILAFTFVWLGASLDTVLLVLTTIVSLEAIYLSIFIQMSVNRQQASIENVEDDIDEIQAEVKEIGDDVDELSDDVDEIAKDVDEISEDIDDLQEHDQKREQPSLEKIEAMLKQALLDLEKIRK